MDEHMVIPRGIPCYSPRDQMAIFHLNFETWPSELGSRNHDGHWHGEDHRALQGHSCLSQQR